MSVLLANLYLDEPDHRSYKTQLWFVLWGGFPANTTALVELSGGTSVNDNSWHHVAVCRNGNDFMIWVDGVLDGGSTVASGSSATSNTEPVRVGMLYDDDSPAVPNAPQLEGYLEELRFTKDHCRYSQASDFGSLITDPKPFCSTPEEPRLSDDLTKDGSQATFGY